MHVYACLHNSIFNLFLGLHGVGSGVASRRRWLITSQFPNKQDVSGEHGRQSGLSQVHSLDSSGCAIQRTAAEHQTSTSPTYTSDRAIATADRPGPAADGLDRRA